MAAIRQQDFIDSVADALQYISYYHPQDYIEALGEAYAAEQSPAAKDAIAQILTNSRMCAEGHRPICQDTGIVVAFVKVGMDVRWEGVTMPVAEMVNEGVRRAYNDPDNKLRASIVADPAGARKNTKDNTPAVVHFDLVPGNTVDVKIAAKGGGSENKSKFTMLNPSDSIVDWVVKTLPTMGAGWCPPGMLGIGIGGTAEKAVLLAKEALMEPIDMHELKKRGPRNALEELRIEIFDAANALGIGAQGLGGLSTVLDVKILDYPTHAASKPVGMIPNCAATRHAHFTLDGSGAALLAPPDLSRWPKVEWAPSAAATRVNLDTLTPAEVATWKPGQTLLLSGKMLTGRDAAHKRICDCCDRGEPLPVDFREPRHLLRRPGRSGARRSRRSRRTDHGDAHGQIHRDDARENRPHRDDRQGRTRTRRDRGDPQAQGRLSDGGRRRRVSRFEGDQALARRRVRRPRHGSDLRVRGEGHAGDRCRRRQRNLGASDRPARVAAAHREDPPTPV